MSAPAGGGNPFWQFSLAVYARPGVPALCLDLQDRRGVDVNMLLFAAWAGLACGVRLSEAEYARLDAEVAGWREEMVRPLRALRRRAKAGDAALYARLKAAELEAERVQQDRLYATSGLRPDTKAEPGGACEAAMANLALANLALANLALVVPGGDGALDELAKRLCGGP